MEREGESVMATGSLTNRWSYPVSKVVEHDLLQAKRAEEAKIDTQSYKAPKRNSDKDIVHIVDLLTRKDSKNALKNTSRLGLTQ
jgi:hypothetical protein